MEAPVRFATWNLDWWHRTDTPEARARLLRDCGADVVALQEVSAKVAGPIRDSHDGPTLFSQDVHTKATWRWMGCGLLLPGGTDVRDVGLVEELPKPQRSLWARVRLPDSVEVTVVSWHTPNAAGDGREIKMAAYAAMSRWLAGVQGPVLVGADLNTWRDPVDLQPADPGDLFAEEHAFVGPDPNHGLVDAHRQVLAATGALDELRRERPAGPLAISHVLPSGAGHRMDRIFVSTTIGVRDTAYLFEDAVAAGSDHALHLADLVLPS